MSGIWWILWAVIWLAIAFWLARVAGRQGHSFLGYFIFSLFPATIIVAYLVQDRTENPVWEKEPSASARRKSQQYEAASIMRPRWKPWLDTRHGSGW
jgi:hypothetical protein